MGGWQNENPGALMTQPGLEDRYATDLSETAQTMLERQTFRLRWVYGLTEANANALAALVWGAGQ